MKPGHQGTKGGARTRKRGGVVVCLSCKAVVELLKQHRGHLITTEELLEGLIDAMELRREGEHAPKAV